MASKKLLKEYKLIEESGLFDPAYYRECYGDVAELKIDPLLHYIKYGAQEGRNPSAEFDALYYFEQCIRLGEQPDNPLLHFITAGRIAGLVPRRLETAEKLAAEQANYELLAKSGLFDPMYYLQTYPDVAELRIDPLLHYIRFGAREARNPSAEFDAAFYLEQCAELGERPDNPLLHFITAGRDGGLAPRRPEAAEQAAAEQANYGLLAKSGLFDPMYYLQTYPDVAELRIDPLLHYIRFGAREARNPSVEFDAAFYLEQCAELGERPDNPLLHFTTAGRDRGLAPRRPEAAEQAAAEQANYGLLAQSGLFDPMYYLQTYPDVAQLRIDPLLHYIRFGAREARNPGVEFNAAFYLEQCAELGERPDNPLLHFITAGRAAGLKPYRPEAAEQAAVEQANYGLLAKSGLFDPMYYLQTYPDVAELRIDPLLHYIRFGAREARNPSAAFDAAFYLEQCANQGEQPENPLLHYVTRGRAADLSPMRRRPAAPSGRKSPAAAARPAADAASDRFKLYVDHPKLLGGAVKIAAHDNLLVMGWALARAGVASVEVLMDGNRVASAHYGLRRDDVEQAYPLWKDARLSGFSAIIPKTAVVSGRHKITVSAKDRRGQTTETEFLISVEKAKTSSGPWLIRRRLSGAEIDLYRRALAACRAAPSFHFVISVAPDSSTAEQVRKTIMSLNSQGYDRWKLTVVARQHGGFRDLHQLRHRLTDQLDLAPDRIDVVPPRPAQLLAESVAATIDPDDCLFALLSPGDEISADAMFEIALTTALHPEADFIYSDERRRSPVSKAVEPFFKPQWSPDLLLSTNYIGRLWCARLQLLRRSGVTVGELMKFGDYELVLRLTECAGKIEHIPALLCERGEAQKDDRNAQKRALERALTRRSNAATVRSGCAAGIFRVQRAIKDDDLVSIIIPTRATRGLIKICLDSLRSRTSHRHIEIICIENIPYADRAWRSWLHKNADKVITTERPFNWSRYNNVAAAQAAGKYLLFLNDDVEVIEPDWLRAMLEHAARPEVGAVGAQLLYPNRTVQHAGVMLNTLGVPHHAFRFQKEDDPGYFGLALTQRNVISVTGACLLTRRDVFDKVGRFDEGHRIVNNDLDYCLKVWRQGLRTIYTPYARLIHHESASRSEAHREFDAAKLDREWGSLFLRGDPYFNPNLSLDQDQIVPETEPTRVLVVDRPLLDKAAIKNILVVKLDHIGDCIAAFPAIRRIKQEFPTAKLHVLSSTANRLLWSLEPAVEEVIEFDFFHQSSGLGARKLRDEDLDALQRRLRAYRFDVAIDLRKHLETRKILPYTGARYLVGFDNKGKFPWLDLSLEWEGDERLARKRRHITDDLMNLATVLANASRQDRDLIAVKPQGIPAIKGVDQDRLFRRPLVCIHPGAGTEIKKWPVRYFSELINALVQEKGLHVALIGGREEADTVKSILTSVRDKEAVWDLVNKIALAELPKLLVRCALFVGNDSGPKHLAASLGVPTIGVHSGVVDAGEWGPVGQRAVAVRREMSCSPCYISRVKDCNRGVACLKGLAPGDVFRACKRLLLTSLA